MPAPRRVHWLIENRNVVFALCGSSARKVRRDTRTCSEAARYATSCMAWWQAKSARDFDLERAVNHGYLPRHYLAADAAARSLRAYVDDYLKEEVAAEGLTRNLPAFADFSWPRRSPDGQLVNCTTIARDCGVSAYTVKEYFQILEDTLLGRFLPAYRRRPKRRVIQTPKFYFADVGVVNHLARRGSLEPGGELFGRAFENWVFHELTAYRAYREPDLTPGLLAAGERYRGRFRGRRSALRDRSQGVSPSACRPPEGLRALVQDHRVGRRVLVSQDDRARRTEDGIDIPPARVFVERLSGRRPDLTRRSLRCRNRIAQRHAGVAARSSPGPLPPSYRRPGCSVPPTITRPSMSIATAECIVAEAVVPGAWKL